MVQTTRTADDWPAAVISDSGFDGFLYAAVAGWV